MRSNIFSCLLASLVVAALTTSSHAAPLPTGACCNDPQGCCAPDGNCFETTSDQCFFGYKGDNTTCAGQCTGACCNVDGSCAEQTAAACEPGVFQGPGTLCLLVECPGPTTTSTSSTFFPSTSSTTLTGIPLCGDANGDLDFSAADALIALKTAVGLLNCSLERCDFNGSGGVTASDALSILKLAVGQPVVPMCPVIL